ncbi:EsaB/YukD family protein [Virgisporangium ochraceum]|uniref:EsaB/YukD family protein n=1 Tax=Virgisporangium ochraceum TaxID=65505 RepID=UPI00194497E8|nr:EsaB/YukD family protein [Virgisporangium ochraceum]
MTDGAGKPRDPDLDPISVLRRELRILHRHGGEPSTRQIARQTNAAMSHTTANAVIRCVKCPRWGQLELVVEALGGDVEYFRGLWINVRNSEDPLDLRPHERGVGTEAEKNDSYAGAMPGSVGAHDAKAPSGIGEAAKVNLERVSVILAATSTTDRWDVALPIDVPVLSIVNKLLSAPELPFRSPDHQVRAVEYELFWKEGARQLAHSETLRDAGVGAGATLIMSSSRN